MVGIRSNRILVMSKAWTLSVAAKMDTRRGYGESRASARRRDLELPVEKLLAKQGISL